MTRLEDIAERVRAKNAGPFWLTIDIFCPDRAAFDRVRQELADARVADALGCAPHQLRRFEIETLNVVKFSLPRPQVQGSPGDRDMHGAAFACLVAALEI